MKISAPPPFSERDGVIENALLFQNTWLSRKIFAVHWHRGGRACCVAAYAKAVMHQAARDTLASMRTPSTAAGGAHGDRWTDWPAAIGVASTAQ
jgi:hypothetical protein